MIPTIYESHICYGLTIKKLLYLTQNNPFEMIKSNDWKLGTLNNYTYFEGSLKGRYGHQDWRHFYDRHNESFFHIRQHILYAIQAIKKNIVLDVFPPICILEKILYYEKCTIINSKESDLQRSIDLLRLLYISNQMPWHFLTLWCTHHLM